MAVKKALLAPLNGSRVLLSAQFKPRNNAQYSIALHPEQANGETSRHERRYPDGERWTVGDEWQQAPLAGQGWGFSEPSPDQSMLGAQRPDYLLCAKRGACLRKAQ